MEDNGPGLPPEDRGQAGQRFFRADKARATPGSGLGLALVQAVAGLHGGELLLEDADPDGRRRGCGRCSACRPHEGKVMPGPLRVDGRGSTLHARCAAPPRSSQCSS